MVPQCVVSLQIGVKNFPCGAQTALKTRGKRAKIAAEGLKLGGTGVILILILIKFPQTPPPAGPFVLAGGYGRGLRVPGRGNRRKDSLVPHHGRNKCGFRAHLIANVRKSSKVLHYGRNKCGFRAHFIANMRKSSKVLHYGRNERGIRAHLTYIS